MSRRLAEGWNRVTASKTAFVDRVLCAYCGRAIRKGTKPLMRDGQPYHKSCWRDLSDPSPERLNRHDIKEGG